jgi:uncharacterized membrane protein (UPF0127 family)
VTDAAVPLLRSLVLALVLAAPSCKSEPEPKPAADAYTVEMKIGGRTFHVEIADTVRKQQLGLMHRKSMPADHGMIFVFPDERERSFWMKNTHIPLDIIYADKTGKVVSVKQMQPLDESPVPSDGDAKYAVELNQGTAKRVGVKAGDVLVIPDEARETGGRRRAAR